MCTPHVDFLEKNGGKTAVRRLKPHDPRQSLAPPPVSQERLRYLVDSYGIPDPQAISLISVKLLLPSPIPLLRPESAVLFRRVLGRGFLTAPSFDMDFR